MDICGWEIRKCGCNLDNVQLLHLEGKVSENGQWLHFQRSPLVGSEYINITRMSHLALCDCIAFVFNRTERRCLISVMQIRFLVLLAMLTRLGRLTGCCIRIDEV